MGCTVTFTRRSYHLNAPNEMEMQARWRVFKQVQIWRLEWLIKRREGLVDEPTKALVARLQRIKSIN